MFRVWAPDKKKVELEAFEGRFPMTRGDDGWWSSDHPSPGGMDYSFRVDGSGPFPDPRSPWQPHGVHGPSRTVDHAAFNWTDKGHQPMPLESGLIYELHVGTFSPEGTFDGIIQRLDHLRDLGVTHVQLMPVADFEGDRGWGYDGVHLFAPRNAYGGPDGLKRLVNACHQKGLSAMLDVVYNHLGPSGNYLMQFAPYFNAEIHTPWGSAINYDGANSDEVRRFVLDNVTMWIRDYHFDGLRLDEIDAILDRNATHIVEDIADTAHSVATAQGRRASVVAEAHRNNPRVIAPKSQGGYGVDALWNDDFHHSLHTLLTGETNAYYADYHGLPDMAKAMRDAYVLDGRHSGFRGLTVGRPATGIGGHRFLAYAQTHDQVGNRPHGERLVHYTGLKKARLAALLVLTSPYVPMLFHGEEWAPSAAFPYFTSFEDKKLGEAVQKGRREMMVQWGWPNEEPLDPQAVETWARARLDWDEVNNSPHREMLDWHKRLIALRGQYACLTDGDRSAVQIRYGEPEGWFLMRRGEINVACNFSDQNRDIELPQAYHEILLASEENIVLNGARIALPAWSGAILK